MNIADVLNGSSYFITSPSEQKEVIEQMKERKIFDLSEQERVNLINFLCDKVDPETSMDYFFHVLDTEISYPIDDEKIRLLFDSEKMRMMKDLMLKKLNEESNEPEPSEVSEDQN